MSEANQPPDKTIEELRLGIKSMLMTQQPDFKKTAGLEDVVVEIDYLPVYEEKEGKLQYGGTKAKIMFSEVRVKPSANDVTKA